jgi:hypothetical protein
MESRAEYLQRTDHIVPTEATPFLLFGGIQNAVRGGVLRGFTDHGWKSMWLHDGVGVSTRAMFDAVKNPLKVINQVEAKILYRGRDAGVVLNKWGEVVTTWARSKRGYRQ